MSELFHNIWTLHKEKLDFWWKSSAWSSEVHSNCTEDHFEKNTRLSQKQDCFVIYGIKAEKKLTFDDSFSALMSTLHFESVELFFDFCQQPILFILFDTWAKICWTFGVKFLAILPKLHSNLQRISLKRNELLQKT